MSETKGSVRKGVGWLTGDREVEAEGRVEERGEDPDQADVEQEKVEVKEEHGDYGRAGPPGSEGPLGPAAETT